MTWCPEIDETSTTAVITPSVVFKSIALICFAIFVLFGNGLVVVSVFWSKALRQSSSSSLILSLAVADLLLALLVLPFSITNEVVGQWTFGNLLCQLYLSIDVWLCTASIYHLVAIAIDRFVVITKPTLFATMNSKVRFYLVAGVWVLSFAVSLPPMTTLPEEFVKLSTADDPASRDINSSQSESTTAARPRMPTMPRLNSSNLNDAPCTAVCSPLNYPSIYIISSSMMSFYLPMLLILLIYVRIFAAVRQVSQSFSSASSVRSVDVITSSRTQSPSVFQRQLSLPPLRRTKSKTTSSSNDQQPPRQPLNTLQHVFINHTLSTTDPLQRKRLSIPTTMMTGYLTPDVPICALGQRMTRSARASACGGSQLSLYSNPSSRRGHGHSSSRKQPYVMVNPADEEKKRQTILKAQSEHALLMMNSWALLTEKTFQTGNRQQHIPTINEMARNRLGSRSATPISPEQNEDAVAVAVPPRAGSPAMSPRNSRCAYELWLQRHGSVRSSPSCKHHLRLGDGFNDNHGHSDNSILTKALRKRGSSKDANAQLLRRVHSNRSSNFRQASGSGGTRDRKESAGFRLKLEICTARTVSIVTGCFLACWLGFAIVYIIKASPGCRGADACVSDRVFTLLFWLGYANSGVNPIIYALFSKQFRRVFRRILRVRRRRRGDPRWCFCLWGRGESRDSRRQSPQPPEKQPQQQQQQMHQNLLPRQFLYDQNLLHNLHLRQNNYV